MLLMSVLALGRDLFFGSGKGWEVERASEQNGTFAYGCEISQRRSSCSIKTVQQDLWERQGGVAAVLRRKANIRAPADHDHAQKQND